MNLELAHEQLVDALGLIDHFGELYDRRWGKKPPYTEAPGLSVEVDESVDAVRSRTRFARDIVEAMGESSLAAKVREHEEGSYGGHPFTQARLAIIEAIAILQHREKLSKITGPTGPQLASAELHPVIWTAATALWDDGHFRAAVQTAGSALEGLFQAVAGSAVSGANLASLFSINEPSADTPRLRLREIDPASATWKSAHEGAAALVRGAFMGVRNLVSHPGWPDPSESDALEMLAVLSYVARLVNNSDAIYA